MAKFDEDYDAPFERSFLRFREQLNSMRCNDLRREGFVVIDNFLGEGWARALLQEMRWLNKQG